jgi:hypothetical protein
MWQTAGRSRVDLLDGRSLAPLQRIAKLDDADNVRYDSAQRTVVIGYGNGALRILHADTAESAGDVPSGHPESFQLERVGSRAFVNVPSARQVAVVDRSNEVIATWGVPELARIFHGPRRTRQTPFCRDALTWHDARV